MATSLENKRVVHFTFEETKLLLESADEKIVDHSYSDYYDGSTWVSWKTTWKKDGEIIATLITERFIDKHGEHHDDPRTILVYQTPHRLESRFKDPRNVFELECCGEVTRKTSKRIREDS